jgi:hypothetical protein
MVPFTFSVIITDNPSPIHDFVLIAPEGAPTHVVFTQHDVGAALAAILLTVMVVEQR